MRQAFAGMLWSKQLYYYDVARWLDGDPGQPPPPASRQTGRNARWRNFNAFDIMSMPDKWEYPWFAAWDLAFHCVALAHVDPGVRQVPADACCAGNGSSTPTARCPPTSGTSATSTRRCRRGRRWRCSPSTAAATWTSCRRVFDKLLLNFTWWVNLEDADGSNLFEGGFLGLDNIGPLDRSHLPPGQRCWSSPTPPAGWRTYALAMGVIATDPATAAGTRPADDLVLKFLEHFAAIRAAIEDQGLWDDDRRAVLRPARPARRQRRCRSGPVHGRHHPDAGRGRRRRGSCWTAPSAVGKQFAEFLDRAGPARPRAARQARTAARRPGRPADAARRRRHRPAGAAVRRSCSTRPSSCPRTGCARCRPTTASTPTCSTPTGIHATIDYEPAESTTAMFGGNSNWRGPIWFPLNYLVVAALQRYHRFFGDDYTARVPHRVGRRLPLDAIAHDLWERLVSIFLVGADGRRPCFGGVERLQHDPRWRDNLVFSEYFHGDNGAGLGATHQTGWTGLVADIIRRRHGEVTSIGDLLRALRDTEADQ